MSVKVKKIFLSILLTCVALSLCASVFAFNKTNKVNASTSTFVMDEGASMRINGDSVSEYGIRFSASLGATYDEDKDYYMMIIPEDWLQKYSLDENADFYGELVEVKGLEVAVMQTYPVKDAKTYNDDNYHIRGSITNVNYKNLNRNFFGIAFSEKDGVREYASFANGQNVRNLGYVASAVMNDTAELNKFTNEQKEYLQLTINNAYKESQGLEQDADATLDTENIALNISSLTLKSGEKNSSVVINGMPETYAPQVVWQSKDEGKVYVDGNGNLTARLNGDTVVTAKVLGKELTLNVSVTMDIPEYFVENNYLDNVIASIPEGKSFIFVTDPHWKSNAKNSPALLKYVKDRANIENIVLGGDILDQENSSDNAAYEMANYMQIMTGLFGTDLLPVLGNHDLNTAGIRAGVNEDKYELYHMDYTQIYDIMFSQLEGVVNSDSADKFANYKNFDELNAYMKMHYYYDDTASGIRYINVVTGNTFSGILKDDFSATNGRELILQYAWLYETLMSVPNGYDVVVTGHAPILCSRDNNIEGDQVGKYFLQVCEMLSAFKTKGKVTVNNDVNNSNLNKFLQYGNTEFDFAEANNVGSVLVLGGDMHWDNACITGYVGGEYTTRHADQNEQFTKGDILVVATHADQIADYSKLPYADKFAPMTAGTITEQCFDIVTLGADGKTYFTRVGVGESRTFEYGATSNYEKRVIPTLNTQASYEVGNVIELNATANEVENYTFTYSVQDPDGKAVEVTGNSFTPLMTGDYKVFAVLNCANALGEAEGVIKVVSTNKITFADYTAPTVGETFTIPNATLVDASDNVLSSDYTVEVKKDGEIVSANESINLYKGSYVITYEFNYNGVTYRDKIEFAFSERAQMSNEMLEDFGDPVSITNVPEITGYSSITYTNYNAEWIENFEGRTGVAKVTTSNSGDYNQQKVGVRFNKTKEQLQAMEFDYIVVKIYVDSEGTFSVGSYNYVFTEISGQTWQEIRITKDVITSSSPKSWYTQNTAAGNDPYDKFCDYHYNKGYGSYLFYIKDADNTNEKQQCNVYIDSVAIVNIDVAEYTEPVANVEFTIPKATISGADNVALACEPNITVFKNGTAIEVQDGKFATQSATYVISYEFTLGNNNYVKEIEFTAGEIVENGIMLQNFALSNSTESITQVSVDCLTATTYTNAFATKWMESAFDAQGVVKFNTSDSGNRNQCKVGFSLAKFDKTVLENSATAYIAFRVYIDAEGTFTIGTRAHKFANVNGREWVEIRMTKNDISHVLEGTTKEYSYYYWKKGVKNALNQFSTDMLSTAGAYAFYIAADSNFATDGVYATNTALQLDVYVDSVTLING